MSAIDDASPFSHGTPAALALALAPHAVWFAAPGSPPAGWPQDLLARLEPHRHAQAGAWAVRDLRPADLPLLAATSGACFMNHAAPLLAGFEHDDVAQTLAAAGLRLFTRHGGPQPGSGRALRHTPIGSLEFLLSPPARLRRQRALAPAPLRQEGVPIGGRRRAVAVLDLVQDYEVLRPLLVLAAGPTSPFDLRVAVSQRVQDSPLWDVVSRFLDIQGITWFKPLGAADVSAALGSAASLLLTASESSANGHSFNHNACKSAPPRALRVTVQHGLECVGLRHHRAHDLDFTNDVRFASDLVLTWADPAELPSLHPAEAHKCVAVGVVKAIAERAAAQAEQRWLEGAPARPEGPLRLLLAENLHSVRFRDPGRYQRFRQFITAASQAPGVELTVRSHPGKRTLENEREVNGLRFLDGMLQFEHLLAFDRFVSPPSTVVLDAVLAGLPTTVWTDSPEGGDVANYAGLPTAADFEPWLAAPPAAPLDASAWAAASTCAFNGVPAAWNTLLRLFD